MVFVDSLIRGDEDALLWSIDGVDAVRVKSKRIYGPALEASAPCGATLHSILAY